MAKRSLMGFVLSGLLTLAIAAPALAGHHTTVQRGGAAGLIAAVVQVAVSTDDINIANNSLNNLLRNADIDVLNNILNNSVNQNEILSNIDIQIDEVLTDNTVVVNVLSGPSLVLGQLTVRPA